LSRLSSSSYSVWHFSQRTSMAVLFGGYGTTTYGEGPRTARLDDVEIYFSCAVA
jgi:hypothetical protein